MASNIEVRIDGRGIVRGDESREDATVRATCSICNATTDAVASLGAAGPSIGFICAGCLRERLDALSVGRWRMRELRDPGLPWGKTSG